MALLSNRTTFYRFSDGNEFPWADAALELRSSRHRMANMRRQIPAGAILSADTLPGLYGRDRKLRLGEVRVRKPGFTEFTVSCISVLLGVMCLIPPAIAQVQPSSTSALSPEEITQLEAKAKEGDASAQLSLGRAYDSGKGVPQNDQQAVKWYRAAAEQGNATAQDSLGVMFSSGRGVERDKAQAVQWYRRAARQKNPTAMFNLGTAYYNGDGVGVNYVAAYAWFLLAQDLGNQSAVEAVKHMKEEKGSFEGAAMERIGDMYAQGGDDLPRSPADAIEWYRRSAAEDNSTPVQIASVQMKLASLLLQPGVDSLYPEVHRLCEKAASQRYPAGLFCMGRLYEQGWDVPRDLSQAAKSYTEAAKEGFAPAILRLGQMYWRGEGVKQDSITAYAFVYLAASTDVTGAKKEKEDLEKELTPKEVEKGKARAIKWEHEHLRTPLLLKKAPM